MQRGETGMRIMFVCHGNICRSPMAELILKDLLKKQGRENAHIIASSATSTEEIPMGKGNPVYPPAARELRKHSIDPDGKYAVQLTKEDYDQYDLLIGMDSANLRNMLRIFGHDKDGKIRKMMSFCNSDADVSDPWYTGDFALAYRDIHRACEGLLRYLDPDLPS